MPKYLRRLAIILLVLTGIYFLVSPFVVPWMVEKQAQQIFADKIDGDLSFTNVAFNPVSLTFIIRDLSVRDQKGAKVLKAASAQLNLSWRSLWAGEVRVDRLALENPIVDLTILENGETNFSQLMKAGSGAPSTLPGIRIAAVEATGARINVTNHNGHRVPIGPVDLTLGGFAIAEGHAVGLDQFGFDVGSGRLSATGVFERAPLKAIFDVKLDRVPVTAITGFIPMDGFTPERGMATGTAKLELDENFRVEGEFTLTDFAMQVDGYLLSSFEAPFADVTGFSFDMNANAIGAESVHVEGSKAHLVRRAATGEVGAVEAADKGPSFTVSNILANGGDLIFEDQTLATPVIFPISSVDVVINDLMFGDALTMGFRGDASAGPNSPIMAAGFLEYGETLEGSISARVDRLDHAVLSPYLYEILGRGTDAGNAYLEFDYYAFEGEIDGLNSFLFDRWEWGDKNPDFEGDEIPLKKAFNLLEGKGGRVEMEIPVEGEVWDPTFRVEGLVRRATNKAISNIITTPFRIIGKLIPGGGKDDIDLNKVRFEPSSAELTSLEKARLHALALALLERPKLRLQMDGVAVPGVDLVPEVAEGGEVPVDTHGLIKLANMRADAVYQYLMVDGITADRLQKSVLEALDDTKGKKPIVRLELLKD